MLTFAAVKFIRDIVVVAFIENGVTVSWSLLTVILVKGSLKVCVTVLYTNDNVIPDIEADENLAFLT